MGNQNCCQNNQNVANEQAKTAYPFDAKDGSLTDGSKAPGGSRSLEQEKENSKPSSLATLPSRDSQIIDQLYKAIECNVIEEATKPIVLFGRKDVADILAGFEALAGKLKEEVPAEWKQVAEATKLSLEVETAVKHYRSKAQKVFPGVRFVGEGSATHYRTKGGVSVTIQKTDDGNLLGKILFGPKMFYEGQMTGNLPHGQGLMFYSLSVIYFGGFRDGRRNGRGVLEQRSCKVWADQVRGRLGRQPAARPGDGGHEQRGRVRGRIQPGDEVGTGHTHLRRGRSVQGQFHAG